MARAEHISSVSGSSFRCSRPVSMSIWLCAAHMLMLPVAGESFRKRHSILALLELEHPSHFNRPQDQHQPDARLAVEEPVEMTAVKTASNDKAVELTTIKTTSNDTVGGMVRDPIVPQLGCFWSDPMNWWGLPVVAGLGMLLFLYNYGPPSFLIKKLVVREIQTQTQLSYGKKGSESSMSYLINSQGTDSKASAQTPSTHKWALLPMGRKAWAPGSQATMHTQTMSNSTGTGTGQTYQSGQSGQSESFQSEQPQRQQVSEVPSSLPSSANGHEITRSFLAANPGFQTASFASDQSGQTDEFSYHTPSFAPAQSFAGGETFETGRTNASAVSFNDHVSELSASTQGSSFQSAPGMSFADAYASQSVINGSSAGGDSFAGYMSQTFNSGRGDGLPGHPPTSSAGDSFAGYLSQTFNSGRGDGLPGHPPTSSAGDSHAGYLSQTFESGRGDGLPGDSFGGYESRSVIHTGDGRSVMNTTFASEVSEFAELGQTMVTMDYNGASDGSGGISSLMVPRPSTQTTQMATGQGGMPPYSTLYAPRPETDEHRASMLAAAQGRAGSGPKQQGAAGDPTRMVAQAHGAVPYSQLYAARGGSGEHPQPCFPPAPRAVQPQVVRGAAEVALSPPGGAPVSVFYAPRGTLDAELAAARKRQEQRAIVGQRALPRGEYADPSQASGVVHHGQPAPYSVMYDATPAEMEHRASMLVPPEQQRQQQQQQPRLGVAPATQAPGGRSGQSPTPPRMSKLTEDSQAEAMAMQASSQTSGTGSFMNADASFQTKFSGIEEAGSSFATSTDGGSSFATERSGLEAPAAPQAMAAIPEEAAPSQR